MNDLADDDEIGLRIEADPLIGQVLAESYQIVSQLGRGGMGVVYKAKQIGMDRFVAVKTLHMSRIADKEIIKRFHAEAQAVCRVRHPHTVNLYDFGVSKDGQPFLVMEYLEGKSFRALLKESGPLPAPRLNAIIQQIIEALTCAHEAGVTHKDLKPENLILSDRMGMPDWVHVLDFGIAGLTGPTSTYYDIETAEREIIGSPPYMSPEQCSMQPDIDHRSDIYSLAIVVFEALCGKFPFRAKTAMEVMDCHISMRPYFLKDMGTNFSTYESVSQVLQKALEKNPEKRYQSVKEFGKDLEQAFARDSKRGLALKDRISSEPQRNEEFIALQNDPDSATANQIQGKISSNQDNGLKEEPKNGSIFAKITGLFQAEALPVKVEEQRKYQVFACPHCGTSTQENLALCLSCGRSLVSTNDFSKIRASRGEFSLPKYQELGHSSNKGFSQKSRKAMIKSGRIWSRTEGLLIICLILIVCVFVMSGGVTLLYKALNPPSSFQN